MSTEQPITEQTTTEQSATVEQPDVVADTPEQAVFNKQSAEQFLQQDAQRRATQAQQNVEEILREYNVRIEPHITITPRGQYAEIYYIPQ